MSASPSTISGTSSIGSSARLRRRKAASNLFAAICAGTTFLALFMLLWLLWGIARDGFRALDWQFLSSMPSIRSAERAGIKPALLGTLWVIGGTILFSVPIGVGAAIFLQEYSEGNRFSRFVQVNIANLAGVPSIVYGILGLTMFASIPLLRGTILNASLTLGLLILPIIIISSQEALRAVPSSLRDGSYALGATRWQTISRQVLPVALPGILTGIILAVSRAIGEAAPLLLIGGAGFITFIPHTPLDHFTTLPIQIFQWAEHPKEAFKALSAAGILVLLLVLLSMNGIAIWMRSRFNKKMG
nr:phosphate transport system permease protein PstA [uncultured bacterium]